MNIEKLIEDVIGREGGFVDRRADHGGPTNFGITLKTLDSVTGVRNNANSLRNIDIQTARDIYRTRYYFLPGINNLPSFIQDFILDMAVLHGPMSAIKLLQDVLIDYGFLVGDRDGIIGKKTIAASNLAVKLGWRRLINTLVDRRVLRYKSIVKLDNSQACFEEGWIARAESFRVNRVV